MSHYPSVLYVEDDALSRMVVEIILREKMGLLNVAIFSDSSDFEARMDEFAFVPDIILLDIHVKPISGFEMLEILHQNPVYRHKPIVALTASVMNEEVDRLRSAGFNGVLAKPVNADSFPNLLQRLLAGEYIWSIT